ncbi:phage tail assembly chaperone [Rhodosalinus sp.]|uniref:phage tail assembly chaperone n=1 Tax=Rhodosalinus sp. TaxID=2047741 RepID=UPI00397A8FF6
MKAEHIAATEWIATDEDGRRHRLFLRPGATEADARVAWDEARNPPQPTEADLREERAGAVRAERARRLAASDWTQVADAPVDQAGWRAYRQALRDVPQQPGFPDTVNWPEEPS